MVNSPVISPSARWASRRSSATSSLPAPSSPPRFAASSAASASSSAARVAPPRHEEALRPRLVAREGLEPLAQPFDPFAGLRREPDPEGASLARPARSARSPLRLPRRGAREVDLVVDDHAGEAVGNPPEDGAVRLLEPPAVVHHREHRVGFLHGRPRPFDADALHRIVGRVQACGIHDLQGEPVHLHRLVEGVPGRARHFGHDRPLPSHQAVQQARLAHVGTPHDHHPEPFAKQVAAGRGPPRRRHRGPDPAEPLGEQRLGQVRDLLVGEVEGPPRRRCGSRRARPPPRSPDRRARRRANAGRAGPPRASPRR